MSAPYMGQGPVTPPETSVGYQRPLSLASEHSLANTENDPRATATTREPDTYMLLGSATPGSHAAAASCKAEPANAS